MTVSWTGTAFCMTDVPMLILSWGGIVLDIPFPLGSPHPGRQPSFNLSPDTSMLTLTLGENILWPYHCGNVTHSLSNFIPLSFHQRGTSPPLTFDFST